LHTFHNKMTFFLLTKQQIEANILFGENQFFMKQTKILLADDNEHILGALTCLLEDQGYSLWVARDGAETLRKVREVLPDILFLDIMMPEINGYDVCRTIKNDPDLKKIYVIMLSAKGQADEQELGKEVGADEYITKPFNPLAILSRLKQISNT
jgi:two-component system alkaline phosphatase synthesis response regulator PhoP